MHTFINFRRDILTRRQGIKRGGGTDPFFATFLVFLVNGDVYSKQYLVYNPISKKSPITSDVGAHTYVIRYQEQLKARKVSFKMVSKRSSRN